MKYRWNFELRNVSGWQKGEPDSEPHTVQVRIEVESDSIPAISHVIGHMRRCLCEPVRWFDELGRDPFIEMMERHMEAMVAADYRIRWMGPGWEETDTTWEGGVLKEYENGVLKPRRVYDCGSNTL